MKKLSPLLWVEVRLARPQLSAAVGAVHVTVAVQDPGSESWLMLAGVPLMAGASSSVTVTVKLDVLSLPEGSVAV